MGVILLPRTMVTAAPAQHLLSPPVERPGLSLPNLDHRSLAPSTLEVGRKGRGCPQPRTPDSAAGRQEGGREAGTGAARPSEKEGGRLTDPPALPDSQKHRPSWEIWVPALASSLPGESSDCLPKCSPRSEKQVAGLPADVLRGRLLETRDASSPPGEQSDK